MDESNNTQLSIGALADQSLANSVAIAVSDATTALRNVQAIMTTVQSVAMARWLESGERDETYQHIVHAATQVTRDAVRLWQEIQATAQAVIGGDAQGVADGSTKGSNANPGEIAKPGDRKRGKKVARKAAKPARPAAAKRGARKPAKPTPAAKKAPAKRAKPTKGPAKPRKPRASKPKPAPPVDVVPSSDET